MASSSPPSAVAQPQGTAEPPHAQVFSPTTGHSIDPSHGASGFNLRQFWHALVQRSWIVAACVLAGLLIAIGYLARTPKLYQGRVILEGRRAGANANSL
jgi:uncharacterized protein involved in exopolysaccharide biosynthesis